MFFFACLQYVNYSAVNVELKKCTFFENLSEMFVRASLQFNTPLKPFNFLCYTIQFQGNLQSAFAFLRSYKLLTSVQFIDRIKLSVMYDSKELRTFNVFGMMKEDKKGT